MDLPFKCPDCGKCFGSQKNVSRHRDIHKRRISCEQCSYTCAVKMSLVRHMMVRHGASKPFSCSNCNDSFVSKRELESHFLRHTKERPHRCNVCGKKFSMKSNLTVHVRIHTGEKPFSCVHCGESFAVLSGLRRHNVRKHSLVKEHKCELCHKAFKEKPDLNKHLISHTKEKPYSCSQCEKSFCSTVRLVEHQRTTHIIENPFKCPFCCKAFPRKSDLKTHIFQHTDERPYECQVCDKAYTTASAVRLHERSHKKDSNKKNS